VGFPSPAADHADQPLNLHEYLVVHPAATYFWRYAGFEMDRAGIHAGALLVVDRSLDARPGDVVTAYHRGEWLVRRLQRSGNRYQLATDPIDAPARAVAVDPDTVIWGVVTHAVNELRAGAVRTSRYADLSDGQG
jgi:DNA polymerase V